MSEQCNRLRTSVEQSFDDEKSSCILPCEEDVPNVIVLVAGTVDPSNSDAIKRALSYGRFGSAHDPNWYWQENWAFRTAIEELCRRYNNLHVFTMHGWSGDNAIANREVAGTYLANRLAGKGGEKAFYKAFLGKEVSFHLIGHSHGGNVINELTKRAAQVWPKKWKIRSVTYLSTPFFQKLHQVNTGAFHPSCKIINVFNEFDLTQRVIADFSLLSLQGLAEQPSVGELLRYLDTIRFNSARLDALKTTRPKDVDGRWWSVEVELMMEPREAAALYDECMGLLERIQGALDKLLGIVHALNQEIQFPIPRELVGKVTSKRKVMSDAVAAQFREQLGLIRKGLDSTLTALQRRRASGTYPLSGFFADAVHMQDFLDVLINFFWVERDTLSGPFWKLVHDFLVEQIAAFDDTSARPEAQFQGTAFHSKIEHVDVTPRDDYHQLSTKLGTKPAYQSFIAYMERAETRYARNRRPVDLMDLIFTLLAQVELFRGPIENWANSVMGVNWVISVLKTDAPSRLMAQIDRLAKMVENYTLILEARSFGRLELDEKHCDKNYGSLPYLMMVSHSISRQDLYPEVKKKLTGQFNTRLRRKGK